MKLVQAIKERASQLPKHMNFSNAAKAAGALFIAYMAGPMLLQVAGLTVALALLPTLALLPVALMAGAVMVSSAAIAAAVPLFAMCAIAAFAQTFPVISTIAAVGTFFGMAARHPEGLRIGLLETASFVVDPVLDYVVRPFARFTSSAAHETAVKLSCGANQHVTIDTDFALSYVSPRSWAAHLRDQQTREVVRDL